jgi:lipopolysaccharide export system protein LptA
MSYRQKIAAAAIVLAVALSGIQYAAGADSKASLSANNINYNVNTKKAHAEGNVIISRSDATIWGDNADGFIDKSFQVTGNVRGKFSKRNVTVTAGRISWSAGTSKNNGFIEASSSVRITHDTNDRLSADYVRWQIDTGDYHARGRVDSTYKQYALQCAEAASSKNSFWATNVAKLENRQKRYVLSSGRIDGRTENGAITEVVANKGLVLDYVDNENLKTHVTGDKAVYSKDRGTIVISGNAKAVRTDGKTVAADTLVVHEDARTIDAVGNSKITFIMNDNAGKNKKAGQTQ